MVGFAMLGYSLNFFCQAGVEKLAFNMHYFPQSIDRILKDCEEFIADYSEEW